MLEQLSSVVWVLQSQQSAPSLAEKGLKLTWLLRSSVSFVAIWLQLVEVTSLLPSMQPRITLKLPIEGRMERLVLVRVYINKTTFFLNRRKSKLPIAANQNEAKVYDNGLPWSLRFITDDLLGKQQIKGHLTSNTLLSTSFSLSINHQRC